MSFLRWKICQKILVVWLPGDADIGDGDFRYPLHLVDTVLFRAFATRDQRSDRGSELSRNKILMLCDWCLGKPVFTALMNCGSPTPQAFGDEQAAIARRQVR
jgi:hypothetical protein